MSPLEYPFTQSNAYETGGVVTSGDTALTAVPNTGGANVKSDYVELIASTAHAASGFWLCWTGDSTGATGATGRQTLVDVAIGAASSEQVILGDLAIDVSKDVGPYVLFFPIIVPQGVRVSIRAQYDDAAAMDFGILLQKRSGNNFPAYTRGKSYGFTAADSGGTQLDPGGVANTKSAFVQLTAATEHPISLLWLCVNTGGNITLGSTPYNWAVDVAVGANPNETVIIPDILSVGDSELDMTSNPIVGPFPCCIPKGSRITARTQCTGTDASDRLIDVSVFGVG